MNTQDHNQQTEIEQLIEQFQGVETEEILASAQSLDPNLRDDHFLQFLRDRFQSKFNPLEVFPRVFDENKQSIDQGTITPEMLQIQKQVIEKLRNMEREEIMAYAKSLDQDQRSYLMQILSTLMENEMNEE